MRTREWRVTRRYSGCAVCCSARGAGVTRLQADRSRVAADQRVGGEEIEPAAGGAGDAHASEARDAQVLGLRGEQLGKARHVRRARVLALAVVAARIGVARVGEA